MTTSSLRTRILATGLDRLALALVALGFVLLVVLGLLNGDDPLSFVGMFLGPILTPSQQGYGIAEVFFVAALLLAGLAMLQRTTRAWRSPAIEAGGSVPLGPSWRERAARAAAMLGERRGGENGSIMPTPTPAPANAAPRPALLLTGPPEAAVPDDRSGPS